MTVDNALQIIQKIVTNTLEEYNQSPESKTKDDQGNVTRIPHPLDIVDEDDELFALDISLKNTALKSIPVSLMEGEGSTAPELKRLSDTYYVRVPATPVKGGNLDIDDGLSYAVVFKALGELYREFNEYSQKGDLIISTYNQAYRKYVDSILSGGSTAQSPAYIRFSADGTNWHDNYQAGDIYISFKRVDTGTWTDATRFVGQDGAPGTPCSDTRFVALQDTPADYTDNGGKFVAVKSTEDGVEFVDPPSGGGASAFTELSDTPADYTDAAGKVVAVNASGDGLEFIAPSSSPAKFTDLSDTPDALTADKWVKVNAAGNALELVDAPAGGVAAQFGDKVFYNDDADGALTIDAQTYNSFFIYPSGDTEISFQQFDDGSGSDTSAYFGTVYTFMLVSGAGTTITFNSNEKFFGDNSVALGNDSGNTNITATLLRVYYDGYSWIVIDRVVVTDYDA